MMPRVPYAPHGTRPRVGDFARPTIGEYQDRVGYVNKAREGQVTLKLWDGGHAVFRSFREDLVVVRWQAADILVR